nr:MAG TPA: hypothetical protein [Herelleviridae sp.]
MGIKDKKQDGPKSAFYKLVRVQRLRGSTPRCSTPRCLGEQSWCLLIMALSTLVR